MWRPRKGLEGGGGSGQSTFILAVLLLLAFLSADFVECNRFSRSNDRSGRREDSIDEWIRTIKQNSPKRPNSISPSWNGKSPYRVIGVGGLPLQNEGEDSIEVGGGGEIAAERRHFQQHQHRQQSHRQQQQGLFVDGAGGVNDPYRQETRRMAGDGERPGFRRPFSEGRRPFKQQGRRPQKGNQRRPYFNNNNNSPRGDRLPPLQARPGRNNKRQQQQHERRRPESEHNHRQSHHQQQHPTDSRPGRPHGRNPPAQPQSPPLQVPEDTKPYQVVPAVQEQPSEHPPRRPPPPPPPPSPPVPGQTVKEQFSDFGPNPFKQEEHPDFPVQSFEGPPRVKPKFPRPAQHPPGPSPQVRRPRPAVGGDLGVNVGRPNFDPDRPRLQRPKRPIEAQLDLPTPPRRKQPSFPSNEEIEHGFRPFFKGGSEFLDDVIERGGDDERPNFRLFENSGDGGRGPVVDLTPPEKSIFRGGGGGMRMRDRFNSNPSSGGEVGGRRRFTTPRPIPVPGPEDFPRPPPRRPPPPPTHPTHPPPITHPPEHFQIPQMIVNPHLMPTAQEFEEAFSEETQRPKSNNNPFGLGPFGGGGRPLSSVPDRRRDPFFRQKQRGERLRHQAEMYGINGNSGGHGVSGKGGGVTSIGENDNTEGFFEIPESFPNLESLGANFESMKIRTKRSAEPEDLVVQERRFIPRRHRGGGGGGGGGYRSGRPGGRNIRRNQPSAPHPQQQQQQQYDDYGFSQHQGFWDDVESEFFTNSGPPFGQRNQPYSRRGSNRGGGGGGGGDGYGSRQRQQRPYSSRHRDPYPQQTVQTYPVNDYGRNSNTGYGGYDERDNEILGSGNFEIIKGGTFYDPDTYYNTRYNSRPHSSYGGDFFENFRDFADIKNDLYRYNTY